MPVWRHKLPIKKGGAMAYIYEYSIEKIGDTDKYLGKSLS
jgi:hypothetical protein